MYDKVNAAPIGQPSPNLGNLGPNGAGGPDGPDNGPAQTGPGVSGQSGPTPPVVTFAYQAILNSLDQLAPNVSDDGALALVALVEGTLNATETASSEDTVNIDSQIKQRALQEQEQQLAAAQKQLEDAASANQNESIWDKIKQAFQVVAAVVTIAVGVALVATGVGALAGALMIAGGAAALAAAINSTVQMATGTGVMGDLVKALGGTAQQASEADMGFGIAMTAIALAYSAATLFTGVSDLSLVAQIATIAGDATNGVTAVVSGVGTGIAASDAYVSAEDTANSDSENATAKKLQAFSDQIEAAMTAILQDIANIGQSYDSALGSLMDAFEDRGKALTQASLTA